MTAQDFTDEPQRLNRHVFVGLAMILAGLALFAVRERSWELDWWSSWWALLLVLVGVVRVVDPGMCQGVRQSRRVGVWLISIGAWGWISQNELFGLNYSTSWPLLVIAAGVTTVWRALEGRPPGRIVRQGGEN
jgi:hypothetical protein